MGARRTGVPVVFDLGAVVFHWQPLQVMRQTLPALAPDDAAAEGLIALIFQGFGLDSDWSHFDLGRIDEQGLAERIAARSGLKTADVLAVIHAIPPALIADPATVDLIRRLKAAGQRVYFLSNMPVPYAAHLKKHNDFFEKFDGGVFSYEVGLMKPSREVFDHASEKFGFAGEPGPVFVDDSVKNVHAAREAGWDGIAYRDAGQCEAEFVNRGLL